MVAARAGLSESLHGRSCSSDFRKPFDRITRIDSSHWMKTDRNFLSPPDRADLVKIARDGLEEHRIARRANVILLIDRGMKFEVGQFIRGRFGIEYGKSGLIKLMNRIGPHRLRLAEAGGRAEQDRRGSPAKVHRRARGFAQLAPPGSPQSARERSAGPDALPPRKSPPRRLRRSCCAEHRASRAPAG